MFNQKLFLIALCFQFLSPAQGFAMSCLLDNSPKFAAEAIQQIPSRTVNVFAISQMKPALESATKDLLEAVQSGSWEYAGDREGPSGSQIDLSGYEALEGHVISGINAIYDTGEVSIFAGTVLEVKTLDPSSIIPIYTAKIRGTDGVKTIYLSVARQVHVLTKPDAPKKTTGNAAIDNFPTGTSYNFTSSNTADDVKMHVQRLLQATASGPWEPAGSEHPQFGTRIDYYEALKGRIISGINISYEAGTVSIFAGEVLSVTIADPSAQVPTYQAIIRGPYGEQTVYLTYAKHVQVLQQTGTSVMGNNGI